MSAATPPAITRPAPRAPGTIERLLREAGDLARFAAAGLRGIPLSLAYFAETLRHAALMLRGTVLLMSVMNAFFGVAVVNFGFFFLRSIGASDAVGLATGYGGPRQIVVTMFGYVFTAKICCGMAAELGAMKIQQEIDAMEATAVDPRRYLVATRLVASLIFTPIALGVACLTYTAGGFLTAVTLLQGVDPHVFLDAHWSVQHLGDWVYALIVCLVTATVTVLVACYYGLNADGGPAGVGTGVARSLFVNLIIVHVVAASAAVLVYGSNLRLPVGG